MSWCCSRLLAVVNQKSDALAPEDAEGNFVESMDLALELIEPLTLYPSTSTPPESIDFAETSRTIRATIEKLIRHALAFVCVVTESEKQPLMTLCHRVMQACIEFQEVCCVTEDASEDDKRLKAEHVQYTLHNLDKLVNDSLLRLFFIVFAELNQNPVAKLRAMKKSIIEQDAVEQQIDKFDDILDRLIQIGAFAVAYSHNAKGECDLFRLLFLPLNGKWRM